MSLSKVDVLELTRKLKREPNIDTALSIMQWELGDLVKSHVKSKWYKDETLVMCFKVEAKKALSDLVFQAAVVAELLGTNLGAMLEIGAVTVKDRAEEIEKGTGNYQFYVGEPKRKTKHG